jgi:hypothetical protein
MSNYDIYKTDGVTKYTIPEKSFNNETDVTFIGNNAQKYGEALQQNFINLLTNFYALQIDLQPASSPSLYKAKAIPGQMIYDSSLTLLLCTEPSPNGTDSAVFSKLALLPCSAYIQFENKNLSENKYIEGQLSGYILVTSGNCHFKKNIASLPISDILRIANLKNSNNIEITGITPVINYIDATHIAITFSGTANATDADINSGSISILPSALKEFYSPSLQSNSYSFRVLPIPFFSSTLSSYVYPNVNEFEQYNTLQHIDLSGYEIFVNLVDGAGFYISKYIIVNTTDDKICDINTLYSLPSGSYTFFKGLQSHVGTTEFKYRLITYSTTMAGVFTDTSTGKNTIIEYNIVSNKLTATLKALPTACQDTANSKIVFLLTQNLVVRVDFENKIYVHNLGNGNVTTVGYYYSPDMSDASQQYNLVDIFYINNAVYYVWGYDGKINITNSTTSTKLLPNDIEILKTSKYDTYFYNNPFGTALAASSTYISFCGISDSNIVAYKFDGTTLSNRTIGTKASFGTTVYCEDVIIDTDIHYIIKGTIVSDVTVNTALSSHTVTELSPNIPKVTYTVLNGTTALGATSNICKYFYYNKKYLLNLNNT